MRFRNLKQMAFTKAGCLLFGALFSLVVVLSLNVGEACATLDLYISGSNNLDLYDGTTGAYIKVLYYSGDGGVTAGEGIVFGPDRNLYMISDTNDKVVRINPTTGALIGDFVTSGLGGLSGPNDLVFGPDGNLYVGDSTQVIRYSGTTGAFIDVFVAAGSGGLSVAKNLAFGPDGNLYVTSWSNGKVIRYNGITGNYIDDFVPSVSLPDGLVFGPDGNLCVSSYGSSQVLKYSGDTGTLIGVFATLSDSGHAGGLSFGPDGNLYVADISGNKVVRFNGTTGAFIDNFAISNPGPGALSQSKYIKFTPLYINKLPSGSGSISCYPNPVEVSTDSLCLMAPQLNYHVSDVLVGPHGSTLSSVGPLWTYEFQDLQQDQDIQASFSGNHIWLFAQNFSLQTVTTTINDALAQAASTSHDALIRVEAGAYFEGSGTGVKCDSDFGGTVPVFSGGWATSLTAASTPTVISPKLTISGPCALEIDEITVE